MPTTRTRRSRNRIANGSGLTLYELEDLLHGFVFFEEPFKDDDERRKCWKKNRAYILSLMGKPCAGETMALTNGVYFEYGTRPHAWWRFDAPGDRLFVKCENSFCPFYVTCPVANGKPTENPDCVIMEGEDRKGKGSFEGKFKIESVGNHFQIFLPIQESERDFLGRCGLLTEGEK